MITQQIKPIEKQTLKELSETFSLIFKQEYKKTNWFYSVYYKIKGLFIQPTIKINGIKYKLYRDYEFIEKYLKGIYGIDIEIR